MRYISVFSGIEAASCAFGPLGMEPVAFAEVDDHASAVLAAHYPDVPNLGDVTKVDWKKYRGKVDLVVGGSPCQSFSIAGKREGLKGESGLMYEFVRCVREVRPRWFLWENVPGALSSEHGAAFGQLLHEMADGGGYGCAWRVLDAQFFGVAQRRRRLFLVGRAGNGFREACQVLFEPNCVPGNSASSRAKREELASRAGRGARAAGFSDSATTAGSIGYEPEQHLTLRAGSNLASTGAVIAIDCATTPKASVDVCHTLRRGGNGGSNDFVTYAFAQNQRREVRLDGTDGQTVGAIPATRSGKQLQGVLCMSTGQANAEILEVRRLTPVECERLQGFPDGWTDVPDFDGKPMSDAQRYKQLGNSMAVPVMRWIGKRILMVDEEEGSNDSHD